MALNPGIFNCMKPQHLTHCHHASCCMMQTYPQPLTLVFTFLQTFILTDDYPSHSHRLWNNLAMLLTFSHSWLSQTEDKDHSFSYMRFTEVGSSTEGHKEFIVRRNYYKARKTKLTCLETLKHFAKQYSCVLQFKNFIEKNPFTPNNITKYKMKTNFQEYYAG